MLLSVPTKPARLVLNNRTGSNGFEIKTVSVRSENAIMSHANRLQVKWLMVGVALGMLAAFSIPMQGQRAPSASPWSAGVVDDWTHHHLVFSDPGTEGEALAHGTYSRWWQIVSEPRYALQQARRSSGAKTLEDPRVGHSGPEPWRGRPIGLYSLDSLKKDWTESFLSGGQVQPNMYPAKFSFSTTTASCASDFVVYPTGVAGASGAANIIAYNNLYVGTGGCEATLPTVDWAYNTGGTVTTSPVIDATGSQVAYVQVSGTTASLVVLKWAASTTQTLTAPGTLTVQGSASAYRNCTAPCFYSVSLGANDTFSSPYYDYTDDVLFVGDDGGKLHEITGVFKGTTIAEASGWPVTLNAADKTTTPVYDTMSGYVFAGNTGGILYAVGTGNAGTTNASIHGTSSALGDVIIDAPLVDSTAGKVYAFVTTSHVAHSLTGCSFPFLSYTLTCSSGGFTSADVGATISSSNGTLNGTTIVGYTSGTVVTLFALNFGTTISNASITVTDSSSNNAVYQFSTSFTSGIGNGATGIGTGGSGYYLYSGAFDNVYYSSTGGTAGDLWAMGNTGGLGGGNLYRIPITGTGAMGTPVAAITGLTGSPILGSYPWPSPITEFCNNAGSPCTASGTATTGGTDYIYFSVDKLAATAGTCGTGSGSGCLLGYSINTPTSTPTRVGATGFTTTGNPGCWTTSGIIVDNALTGSTTPAQVGGSQIYFLALNGNGAGGPTLGTYTSSSCTNADSHIPAVYQESQTAP
jgi:hypothetical protein